MARRTRRTRGFWRGLLSGLALAAAAALGLAIAFPPTLFLPPAVETGRLLAPAAPGAPTRADDPGRPHGPGALADRQAALPVAAAPAAEAPIGIDPFAPPPTPEVFGARPGASLPAPAAPTLGTGPDLPADADGTAASSGALPALAGLPAAEAAPDMGAAFAPPPTPRLAAGDGGAPLAAPGAIRQTAYPGLPGEAAAPAAIPALAGRPDVEASAGMGPIFPPPTPTVFDGGRAGSPLLAAPEAD